MRRRALGALPRDYTGYGFRCRGRRKARSWGEIDHENTEVVLCVDACRRIGLACNGARRQHGCLTGWVVVPDDHPRGRRPVQGSVHADRHQQQRKAESDADGEPEVGHGRSVPVDAAGSPVGRRGVGQLGHPDGDQRDRDRCEDGRDD